MEKEVCFHFMLKYYLHEMEVDVRIYKTLLASV